MHGLTQSALLKALGWSLFNSLWQMSLLWAVYHLFVLVFREASSRARHGFAVILLAAGAGWTLLTFITTYRLGTAAVSFWLPEPLLTNGNQLRALIRWCLEEGLSWCSCCYLVALSGLLLRNAGHYLHSRRISNEGLSKIAPGFRVFVTTTARNMGIVRPVRVHLSALVDVPLTLGFLKPVILLPVAMITHLTTQQVEAILVHELAHVQRKDYLINLLVTVMDGLFFFNPFARMLMMQLKKEREHSCDDLVLQFQYDPHAYVSALLSLARQHRHGRLAVAATGGGNHQLLLQRARKILQHQKTDERPGARPLFLLFLTLGMTFLFWAVGRVTPPSPASPVAASQPVSNPRNSIETSNRSIVNGVSRKDRPHPAAAATAGRTPHVHHRTAAHAPAPGDPNDEGVSWYNTSGTSTTPAPSYADMVIVDNRDYSIGSPANDARPLVAPPPANERFPFVPQSSFSFQYTDTLPPEDRLAMMQMATEKTIRVRISQLQEELNNRMNALLKAQSELDKAAKDRTLPRDLPSASRQQLDQLIRDQLRLQQQFLIRLDNLQRQLQRAARRLTTVYI